MSVDIPDVTPATPDYASALQQVVAAKAAWRKHAQSLTWEEKVAAIERMWVRDREMKKIRERDLVSKNVVSMKAN
jgi:hypothetical protein